MARRLNFERVSVLFIQNSATDSHMTTERLGCAPLLSPCSLQAGANGQIPDPTAERFLVLKPAPPVLPFLRAVGRFLGSEYKASPVFVVLFYYS